ncbi:MAG: HAMP domain-containing protein [Candidatus Brocadiales bacterium]|nr:HAMP domain-containing protein [Candidatus Brocadiales bacterium]
MKSFKFPNKLKFKFLFITIGIVLMLGLSMLALTRGALMQKLVTEVQGKGIFMTKQLAEMSAGHVLTEQYLQLRMLIDNYKTMEDIEYIFIEGSQGAVLAHTFKSGFPAGLKEVNHVGPGQEYKIQSFVSGGVPIIDVASPIMSGDMGTVHIGISEELILNSVSDIVRLIIMIIAGVLIFGAGIAVIFTRRITKPLSELVEVATEIGGGNLDREVDVRTKDEIGQLGNTFNKMIKDLKATTVSRDELSEEVIVRKQAEEELNQKQQELIIKHNELNVLFREIEVTNTERQKIMDSVGEMIILIDGEGIIKRVNSTVKDFTGKSNSEILDTNWDALINDNELETMILHNDSIELFHVPTRKWFTFNAYPFEDSELGFSGSVITLNETTEIKKIMEEFEKTNKEIERNRENLQNALNNISELIDGVIHSKDHVFTFDNPNIKKCYEIKNCDKEECPCHGKGAMRCWKVAGTFCGGKIQGAFAQKYGNCTVCNVYKDATTDPIYMIGEHFNNMMHILELNNKELKDAYTELSTSQSQVLQQEKMASIGQLAAGVAHEINNPMGFISSNLGTLDKYVHKLTEFIDTQTAAVESLKSTEVLEALKEKRKKLKLDYIFEDVEQLIQESLEGAERVKKIVQNLKTFSRVDQAEYKPADINECIESTLNIVWHELKYKTTVEKDYGKIALTKCYPQQLNQVFMNLLINAAQAIEKQGEIKIKTWNGDGTINISISDTGQGIPEDKISKIFEPFYTTKPVGKGTGLGLSIAYEIVHKHNGEITIDSEVGKGTTFNIRIPVIGGDIDE